MPMQTLVIYIHDYCHLCEEMQEQLRPLVESARIVLRVVDLDDYPDLQPIYSERVPVLARNDGEVICFGRLDTTALARVIDE
jgi:thioredoxin reductase (NADPH)